MREIVALDTTDKTAERSVFLAGGITNCPDWQVEMVHLLSDTDLVLFNPRRPYFPMGEIGAARGQIEWEFNHLERADCILFWFPCETLCPIVLYELGRWAHSEKTIFVGVHPQYQRREDVRVQIEFARPEVAVMDSLKRLSLQVKTWQRMRLK